MKRYWEIKRTAMSQILLYRLGEWYTAFYNDLDLCLQYFEMIVVPHPRSYQLGFPARLLNENVFKLVSAGFRVAVCEQKETRGEMERR
jgi:DNA mismatch repair protein MutS